MLLALDLAGIAASSGSACASGSLDPSHVLIAMGLDLDAALGSLRLTTGYATTDGEVTHASDDIHSGPDRTVRARRAYLTGFPGRMTVEEELARRLAHGEEIVLATVIRLDGEPPSHPGAKLLMSSTAIVAGTLGCSEFDSAALADPRRSHDRERRSCAPTATTSARSRCTSSRTRRRRSSVVFAATPIARALLRWAPEVGFRPVLVETRTERMAGAEWPGAIASLGTLREALTGDVYAVHTDHDAEDLVQSLEVLLPSNPRFIGLVGSGRHTGHHLDALRAKGVAEAVIGRIQTPVGLDIGARTPEEIALSILAGLVAVRRGATGGWKQGSTNR